MKALKSLIVLIIFSFILTAVTFETADAGPRVIVYKGKPWKHKKVVVVKPGKDYVWVYGHYKWQNGKRVWVPGHWKRI